VPNKVGVNCDENGEFQITLDNILLTDTITISCVGYKTMAIPKSAFIKNTEFFLSENTELLNAITVKPTGQEIILGRREEGGVVTIVFLTDEKTKKDTIRNAEIGLIMDNHRPVLLQEVGLYIKENTFDALTFR
jgi:CO/xanthine dehydrogenase FAD-binding subunit